MNNYEALVSAETKHRKNLEHFLEEVFRDVFLPSHGPEHHLRVWINAMELSATGISGHFDEKFAEKLIIACFLHDAGMAYDRSEKHGVVSMELCRKFLIENNMPEDEFTEVLDAIMKHDDKSYKTGSRVTPLNIILNIADDLDAFGFTGIYRYIEIFSERGIPLNQMAEKVLNNATARFQNFTDYFGSYKELYEKHLQRFKILEDFFRNYMRQSEIYSFGTESPEGYCGIAEVIQYMFVHCMSLKYLQISNYFRKLSDDPVITGFFREFEKEISNMNDNYLYGI